MHEDLDEIIEVMGNVKDIIIDVIVDELDLFVNEIDVFVV